MLALSSCTVFMNKRRNVALMNVVEKDKCFGYYVDEFNPFS